jgi:hypothetical protein
MALLMRELGGHSYSEIADVLGVDEPAVKGLIARARISLRTHREATELACASARGTIAAEPDGRRYDKTIRRHLRGCPGCRAYRSALREDARALRSALPIQAGAVATGSLTSSGILSAAKGSLLGYGLTQAATTCAASACAVGAIGGMVLVAPVHRLVPGWVVPRMIRPAPHHSPALARTIRHHRVRPRQDMSAPMPAAPVAHPASPRTSSPAPMPRRAPHRHHREHVTRITLPPLHRAPARAPHPASPAPPPTGPGPGQPKAAPPAAPPVAPASPPAGPSTPPVAGPSNPPPAPPPAPASRPAPDPPSSAGPPAPPTDPGAPQGDAYGGGTAYGHSDPPHTRVVAIAGAADASGGTAAAITDSTPPAPTPPPVPSKPGPPEGSAPAPPAPSAPAAPSGPAAIHPRGAPALLG